MIRTTLLGIPDYPPPRGISVRWYAPGDEYAWLDIHREADRFNEFPAERFREEFGNDLSELARRQCFLVDTKGDYAGTATAWSDQEFCGGEWGRIHWVAVRPGWQRAGLGKVLVSEVCRRLAELGHHRAFLTTSDSRLPAVALYRKFGFVPAPQSSEESARWKEISRLV